MLSKVQGLLKVHALVQLLSSAGNQGTGTISLQYFWGK